MPPAVRKASLPDALHAFAAQSDVLLSWAGGLTEADLAAPSRIAGWSVRDVLAHLTTATEALAGGQPGRGSALAVSDYVGSYVWGAEDIKGQPAEFVGDPRERLGAAVTAVLDRAPWPATVVMWDDRLTAADAVATRVLELVVHGDDVGVAPDRDALGLVCRLLTGVFASRHPGRAVELRVAPFAAVQVLAGTVHRRGTPTAVVSVEPLPWVRLATGRASWVEVEAGGALQASGERSDLSSYLPLLS